MAKKFFIIILLILAGLVGYQTYQKFHNSNNTNQFTEITTTTQTNLTEIEDLINTHQYQKAQENLKTLLQINTTNQEALFLSSKIYLLREKNDLAEKFLEALKKLKADSKQIAHIQFLLQYQRGQYQLALKTLQKSQIPEKKFYEGILRLLQDDIVGGRNILLNIQGQAYQSLSQQILNDISLFETYQDANLGFLHAKIGKSLKNNQEVILAKKFLLKAVSNQNQFRDAWLYLGHIYLETQKYADAIKVFEKAKQMSPYYAETHLMLGSTYYFLKQYDRAIKYLENAISFKTQQTAKASEYLGLSYYAQGQNTKAISQFNKSHQAQTLDLDSYASYIYLLSEQADTKKLNSIIQRLQKAYPQKAMSYNLQGWIKLIQKDFSSAKKFLNLALKKDPHLAAAFLNLGQISLAEEKNDLATTYFQKAAMYAKQKNEISIYNKANELLQTL